MKTSVSNKFISIYLIIILSGLLIDKKGSNDAVYYFTAAFICVIVGVAFYQNNICVYKNFLTQIPFFMMMVWGYGLAIGILHHNKTSYMLRNFAGMTFYVIFYFVLLIYNDYKKTIKMCLGMSAIIVFLTVMSYIDMFVIQTKWVWGVPLLGNFQTAWTVEYGARELIYISYVYSLKKLLERKAMPLHFGWILLCWYAEIVCIKSGGDTLAMLIFTALVLYRFAHNHIVEKKLLFILLISIITIMILMPASPIREIFSASDEGNQRRISQIYYIFNNLTFWGHGLGAVYPSEVGSIYAVETIYLDIIYKFGIFAGIVFACYLITWVNALRLFFDSKSDYDVLPLACLGYMIPSLANPILFGSVSVMTHSIALFYMTKRKPENEEKSITYRNELL